MCQFQTLAIYSNGQYCWLVWLIKIALTGILHVKQYAS